MKIRHLAAALAATALVLSPAVAHAGSFAGSATDHSDQYDNPVASINIIGSQGYYNSSKVFLQVSFEDLAKVKRTRYFASFENYQTGDAHDYSTTVEFARNPKGKTAVRTWVTKDGVYKSKHTCTGVKVKADYKNDILSFTVPTKCLTVDNHNYVMVSVDSRKYDNGNWSSKDPDTEDPAWHYYDELNVDTTANEPQEFGITKTN